MSEFTYSVRIGIDKELPAVSSGDYGVDFCASGAASQTPPKLQISLAAFGTSAVEGVVAECYTVGTTEQTLIAPDVFSTAVGNYVYLRESSGHTNASILVSGTDTALASATPFSRLEAGSVAFFQRHTAGSLVAKSFSTSATGTIQVVCVGE